MGQRVAQLREKRGWTQRELAESAGMSVTFLSEIENGKRNVSSEMLLRLADALNASLDYLLRGSAESRTVQQPLTIPPELSTAAERQGWSFEVTVSLLRGYRAVLARRGGPGGERDLRSWTAEDWERLHHQFYEDE